MTKKNKSQIGGSGYGDSHIWIRGDTSQGGLGHTLSSSDKATHYHCEACGAGFIHRYDLISDIFVAIKNSGVEHKCPKLK